jgi:hypothetical protein
VYAPIVPIVILISNARQDKTAKKMVPVWSVLVKAVSRMPIAREWAMSVLLKDEALCVVVVEQMKTAARSFAVRNQAKPQSALSGLDVQPIANV